MEASPIGCRNLGRVGSGFGKVALWMPYTHRADWPEPAGLSAGKTELIFRHSRRLRGSQQHVFLPVSHSSKRLLDLALAIIGLVYPLPVLADHCPAGAQFTLGSPVMFHQVRPGVHGNHSAIIKFRTMSDSGMPRPACLPDKPTD